MNRRITTYLNSPLGYKYKCVLIYNYVDIPNNKLNGTFYIGNPKTKAEEACVTISVIFPGNIDVRLADPSIASLILVKYYETCSENKELPHGEGTVDMINTSMSFVKQICPFIKEFKLNDASTKKCDNGTIISLPLFYLTQYEMTWYERRFKAYLKEPNYTNYKNTVATSMSAILPSFDKFSRIFIKNTPDVITNELKSVYTEGDIIKEFFRKLYDKYDKSMGCILLQPWIDNYMAEVGLQTYVSLNIGWYISVDTIPTYVFKKGNNNTYKINNINNTRKKRPWN